MNGTHVNKRVKKHRDAKWRSGLRPVQIWVPDTRSPDFGQECRRQSILVPDCDLADPDTGSFPWTP